jgi:hypothetical protein
MMDIEQWREKEVRGPRGMTTCELSLAAKMATRCSRHHGELYLRQNRWHGEVEDVEGLKVVLWLRGIR